MTQTPRRRIRSRWSIFALLAGATLTCALIWRFTEGRNTRKPTAAIAPIPVTTAKVETADFAVYLAGLGSVEPNKRVTVGSRVDGTITSVAFKQGQMVRSGDILAQIDPLPYQATLDQAIAKQVQDKASLSDAQLNLARYASLASQQFASRQQLDTQRALVAQLLAQINGDQAAIDGARTQLGYTTIKSPISGKAGFRLIDPGNIVHADATTGIVTIDQLQPISVEFTATEQDIPRINKALAAGPVAVTALGADGVNILAQGRLALVNNQVDQASGTIGMKAVFANADDALWPGLAVTTRMLVETLKQVTTVNDDAIQHGVDGLYAFVVGAGDKVEQRPIKIGPDDGTNAVVVQGLSPGETVVIAGQYRLVAGAIVAAPSATPGPPAKVP